MEKTNVYIEKLIEIFGRGLPKKEEVLFFFKIYTLYEILAEKLRFFVFSVILIIIGEYFKDFSKVFSDMKHQPLSY